MSEDKDRTENQTPLGLHARGFVREAGTALVKLLRWLIGTGSNCLTTLVQASFTRRFVKNTGAALVKMGRWLIAAGSNRFAALTQASSKKTETEPEPITPPAAPTWRIGDALVAEGLVSVEQLEQGLRVQQTAGGRLGDILQAQNGIRAFDYYQALARHFDIEFVDLTVSPVEPSVLEAADRDVYAGKLVLPIKRSPTGYIVATADPCDQVFELIREKWGEQAQVVVTSKFDIFWTLQSVYDENYSSEIVTELYDKDPEMSALNTFTRSQQVLFVIFFVLLGLLFYLNFQSAAVVVNVAITLAVTGVLLFKFLLSIVGLTIPVVRRDATVELDEKSLPVYTILVPMYQESNITITNLAKNLQQLDYPLHQLDIKMVVEADDDDTIEIIKSLQLPSFFEITRVPPSEPRTKPKACNYALKFARGEFVVIYDAEDQPEPGQLKLAINTFRESNDKLACIQCALNYYNSRDNWLTRMFTMEYTFWFDLMLPAMSRLRIPIPLGGTSNHFRTDFLKQMVAWDPYNVTEDADLGIRMNRLGYESKVIASTTWEEATSRVISWIKQRTRWLKGYMQTYLVHLRRPLSLYRDFGAVDFIAYHLFIGGTVFSSLVNLVLVVIFLITVIVGFDETRFLFPSFILECALFNLVVGNLLLILLHLLAIWRRKMYDMIPYVITVPVYWLLASIASYRALYQLLFNPFYWDKTEHGVSKHFDSTEVS